jgi:hypothetical protein
MTFCRHGSDNRIARRTRDGETRMEGAMTGTLGRRIAGVAVLAIGAGCVAAARGAEGAGGEPSVSGAREATVTRQDFEATAVGSLPKGWSIARTGAGEGSEWKVVEDSAAPKGSKVLAQTAESPGPIFNLCVADDSRFTDVQLSVAFKAVKGKKDQGGGVVWRYRDEKNYYVARFNPLEDNFRLYKVVAGKRIQLATGEGLKAPAGEWQALMIQMKGDKIVCFLNGRQHLEASDGTFADAGKVGLWTKADAQTFFDDFQAKELAK